MKRTPLIMFALTLVACAALTLLPAQQTVSADSHGGSKALHDAMEKLADDYRSVRRQMKDASKNAETADLLAGMIAVATESKKHLPKTASTDDLKSTYRVVMNKLIVALAQAENAALQGDQDKLKDFVLEANRVKGEGHELFIPDEE